MKKRYIVVLAGILATTSCAGVPKTGVTNGEFLPCPSSPNCVSSMAATPEGFIEPIDYTGLSREVAQLKLTAILKSEIDCRIIEIKEMNDGSSYIHAEFRSKFFRFVDDVEFLFPQNKSIIHVRSASRVGYSDMGVNRKRVERLRLRFSKE